MVRHAIAARAAIVSQRWEGGKFCPRRRSPAKVGSRYRSVALERRRTQSSILDFSRKKEMPLVRQFGWVYRCQSISNSLSQNSFGFGIFWEPRDCSHPIIL
jgi:hypothetical protein